MSVHHHIKTQNLLLGCDYDVKQMSSNGGDILFSIPNKFAAKVGEHGGNIFISTKRDDVVRILKYIQLYPLLGNHVELFSFPAKNNFVSYISVSSEYIAALAGDDNTLQLYNRANKTLAMKALPGHSNAYNLHFLPDGSLLVTGQGNKVIKYRILESGELEVIWTCDGPEITFGVTSDSKGLIFVSGAWNKTIFMINEDGE